MKKTLITLALTMITSSAFAQMDSSTMNHDNMDHSQMGHGSMQMDQTKMDHSNMQGMSGTSAVGMPANGAKPDKVVHVILSDNMKITFKKEVNIEPNDVVQFVVMNTGKINHEFSIGSAAEQLEHREMMKAMSGDHMHDFRQRSYDRTWKSEASFVAFPRRQQC